MTISVSIENISQLGRKLTIKIPQQEVETAEAKLTKEMAGKVKIDGFRKGHVPVSYLKKEFGSKIRHDVVMDLMDDKLKEVSKQHDLNPIGQPQVEKIMNEPGKDLEFVVNCEIYPQIILQDFSTLEIEKPEVTISDADVEKTIEKLREQHANWIDVDGAAENNDRVTIDFTSKLADGSEYRNSSANSVTVKLGEGSFLPELEKKLLATKANSDIEFSLTFPDDWHDKDLASKQAIFKVKIIKVQQQQLAELDADFAKKLGISDGDVAQINSKVKEQLQEQVKNLVRNKLSKEIFDKISASYEIEIPQSALEQEMQAMHAEGHKHGECHHTEEEENKLRQNAAKRVKLSLLVGEIVKQYKISVDKDKFMAKLDNLFNLFSDVEDPELIKKLYAPNSPFVNSVRSSILLEQVVDLITEKAQLSSKNYTLDEIMHDAA